MVTSMIYDEILVFNQFNYPTIITTPIPTSPKPRLYYNFSSSSNVPTIATTFSPMADDANSNKKTIRGFMPMGIMAMEKEFDDQFLDFRQSMLQMILKNEVYSKMLE
ncbi:hypothetical protein LINPERPRIM_LOCUS965 [Linum perenne]